MACWSQQYQLSQHGVTWDITGFGPRGTFVNGDHWVVGPVQITAITPSSTQDLTEQIVDLVDATAGTFRLTFNAQQTAAIAFDASAATVETAIENLSNVTDVTVIKTWQGYPQWSVQFVTYDGPIALMTLDASSLTGGRRTIKARVKNGSVANPLPAYSADGLIQGYDTATNLWVYNNALNVAYNVSPSTPYTLQPGTSLVSTISKDLAFSRPTLQTAAVLTCLGNVPPTNSFRPAWSGTDKTLHNTASMTGQLGLLRTLAASGSAPTLSSCEALFAKPWIDHGESWMGEMLRPEDNLHYYGRELSTNAGISGLLLHCNVGDKTTLLQRMVQTGIDYYGVVGAGGDRLWEANGGYAGPQLFLILLAGTMLNHAGMKATGAADVWFGHDRQTFYVAETSPGVYNFGFGGYVLADVGLPEWGQFHAYAPQYDNKDFNADSYRIQGTGNAWSGMVLAARMTTGMQTLWAWDALFDYMDRYMTVVTVPPYQETHRAYHTFMKTMWETYRASF